MRRTAILASAALILIGMAAARTGEAARPDQATSEKTVNSQTVCPVMGEPIDKNVYVDYQGKRVYLCCKMCLEKVQNNPAKYIKKLEDQGITLEKVETAKITPASSGKQDRQH